MKPKLYLFLIIILIIAGCTPVRVERSNVGGLAIPDLMTGLGGEPDRQVLSYEITLLNTTGRPVQVDWIKPVLSAQLAPLADKIAGQNLVNRVGQNIPGGQTIRVKGEINLDTTGLGKLDLALGQAITGFQLPDGSLIPIGAAQPTP